MSKAKNSKSPRRVTLKYLRTSIRTDKFGKKSTSNIFYITNKIDEETYKTFSKLLALKESDESHKYNNVFVDKRDNNNNNERIYCNITNIDESINYDMFHIYNGEFIMRKVTTDKKNKKYRFTLTFRKIKALEDKNCKKLCNIEEHRLRYRTKKEGKDKNGNDYEILKFYITKDYDIKEYKYFKTIYKNLLKSDKSIIDSKKTCLYCNEEHKVIIISIYKPSNYNESLNIDNFYYVKLGLFKIDDRISASVSSLKEDDDFENDDEIVQLP
jgi:hypothetical protein